MEKEELIVERYTDGVSVNDIASEMNMSVASVYHVLNKRGVKMTRKPVYSMDVMRSVVDAYNSGRHTLRQVADMYGVSDSVVYKWVNLDKAGKLGCNTRKRKSRIDLDELKRLYQKGFGIRKIGEKLEVSPTTVKHHLKSAGIYGGEGKSIDSRSKHSESDIARLVELYTTTSQSLEEITETCGFNIGTARQILFRRGIKRPQNLCSAFTKRGLANSSQATFVVSDYKTGLFTHVELAKKYGVSTRTISRILDKAGVEAIGCIRQVSAGEVAMVLAEMKADLADGLDMYSVAVKYGIPFHTVEKVGRGRYDNLRVTRDGEVVVNYYHPVSDKRNCAAGAGGADNDDAERSKPKPKGTKADRVRADVLAAHNEGLGAADIAARCGVSIPTVRKVLREAGVVPHKHTVETAHAEPGLAGSMADASGAASGGHTVEELARSNQAVRQLVLGAFGRLGDVDDVASELGLDAATVDMIVGFAR